MSHVRVICTLNAKRDLFYRHDATTTNPTLTNSTVPPPLSVNSNSSSKESLSSRDSDRMKDTLPKDMDGYVGFANLPNQVYRKAVKRGFEFTLMVVGEAGLGKSTLINSMFLTEIYSNEYPGPSLRVKKTLQVETSKVLLKESGVNLLLTVVDTPGFGDAVDNSQCWSPISDYIDNKYEEYLNAESRVHRTTIPDGRVHCCLYFIAPSGHGLKPLDIEFMKRLHDRVNIIPLVAKADTMTPEECHFFKRQIMTEIAQNQIKIYEFPECDDEDENRQLKIMKERVPFAVVGSNTLIDVNGKQVRGRKYPWGVAEVENMEHCDFLALRNMLLKTHMQDLKDVTNSVHYENFRCRKLAGVGTDGKPSRLCNKNPLDQLEEEKREQENKMKRMEQEMEQVFELKVREKRQKLKDSELDLQKRHEQIRKSLEQQKNELEDRRKNFEKDKANFELVNKDAEDAFKRMTMDNNSKETVSGSAKNTPRLKTKHLTAFLFKLDGKEKKKEKKKGLF
ncbi:septin-7 isoform X2 [Parasteatoda tepidariorum]|uniref:septin-7 isoform X2 n=1 Tax=Parasteatoda tepidariorum TaxID=114398 RepID=UPI001C72427C|nr:septin-7 isoform X3 [Parasteatoda tepidariorum]